jgi:hypothetical protein
MAARKSSARQRAEEFLVNVGTAGGPVGSEALYTFGATDLATQVQSGNIDQYAAMRGANGERVVGSANAPAPAMPRDIDSAYLKLNLPGSPLVRNALLSPQLQRAAEATQNGIITNEQYLMLQGIPQTGMLPLGLPPVNNSKGGKK